MLTRAMLMRIRTMKTEVCLAWGEKEILTFSPPDRSMKPQEEVIIVDPHQVFGTILQPLARIKKANIWEEGDFLIGGIPKR